ncbi:MAG: hypothetical protein MUD12_13700 [Spirochaetes bacterium]|nr:hypothetical protein [Spirochaetota bacterium]
MNAEIYGNLLTAMAVLLLSAIIVPIAAGKRKLAGWLNFIFVSAAAAIILNISLASIFAGSVGILDLGPLGLAGLAEKSPAALALGGFRIYILVDPFAAFFMAIISFMAVMSAFYSIQYMEHYPDYGLRAYYLNFPVFVAGMIGLVTFDDLSIGFTIAWQLMTVSSYFLVRFEFREKGNVRSANKYLALMELAWAMIVGATLFINGAAPGDSIHTIVQKLSQTGAAYHYVIFGLIFIGFGFKAGIFPLGQLWLPDAHSIAPSPISALLSGVMLKTGIYGIMRTFFWMVPHGEGAHFDSFLWGVVIASFGVVTLFIGTVQSMKQSDAKRLLAYSSIGQIGYIVFATGAALLMTGVESQFVRMLGLVAIIGAVYHVLNHAVFKGLLFLTSGSVLYAAGTKDLNRLGGLIKFMPVTAVVAGIASLSISGVPPFSGFASKWTIISTSILAGSEIAFLALFGIIALFTSAVTLSCYVKFFGMTFTSAGTEWTVKRDIKEVPGTMLLPKIILTAACLVQGLVPFFYISMIAGIFRNSAGSLLTAAFGSFDAATAMSAPLLGAGIRGADGTGITTAVPAVVLGIFLAALLFAWLLKRSGGSQERVAPTWLCGYQELRDSNRYKDRNMFSSLKNFLWWTGGNVKK